MRGVVDRFEGELVVVELAEGTQDFPRHLFPKNLQVGDAVDIKDGKGIILKEETEKLRKEIHQLMEDVWEK